MPQITLQYTVVQQKGIIDVSIRMSFMAPVVGGAVALALLSTTVASAAPSAPSVQIVQEVQAAPVAEQLPAEVAALPLVANAAVQSARAGSGFEIRENAYYGGSQLAYWGFSYGDCDTVGYSYSLSYSWPFGVGSKASSSRVLGIGFPKCNYMSVKSANGSTWGKCVHSWDRGIATYGPGYNDYISRITVKYVSGCGTF